MNTLRNTLGNAPMETPLERIGTQRDQTGESPLWSVAEQALYWVDIAGRQLRRCDWARGTVQSWTAPGRIACIALHAEGGLLGAMENRIVHLWPGEGDTLRLQVLHEVHFPEPGMRFNDGRCDRAGRFWVSSMLDDMSRGAPVGSLYRLDGPHLTSVLDGLITGNGLAFSPDNRRLYLSDSHSLRQRIWHFDLSAEGEITDRREFVDMNLHPGRPDGAAVDVDGGYWICGNDGGVVHRFTPGGTLDRSIRVPMGKPAMCAFGGPALDHLFITSITPAAPLAGFDAAQDGALLITRPGIAGLPETPYTPTSGDTR
jgi:sugar lactone lactonase YvrE